MKHDSFGNEAARSVLVRVWLGSGWASLGPGEPWYEKRMGKPAVAFLGLGAMGAPMAERRATAVARCSAMHRRLSSAVIRSRRSHSAGSTAQLAKPSDLRVVRKQIDLVQADVPLRNMTFVI